MKLHSVIGNICLMASVACLALVYGLTAYSPVLLAIPPALLLWILLRRRPASWRASILLCVYLVLAVAGVLLGRPPLLLILGSITALAWWDQVGYCQVPNTELPTEVSSLLLKYRLQSLAITTGTSLLLVVVGLWLHVHLPFGAIVLLILLATGCLVYAVGVLRNPPLSR